MLEYARLCPAAEKTVMWWKPTILGGVTGCGNSVWSWLEACRTAPIRMRVKGRINRGEVPQNILQPGCGDVRRQANTRGRLELSPFFGALTQPAEWLSSYKANAGSNPAGPYALKLKKGEIQ